MQSREEKHVNTELLIELIQGALEAEGHETKRFSDSERYSTTAYDCIVVKDADGNYYDLTVREHVKYREPNTGKIHFPEETFNNIRI